VIRTAELSDLDTLAALEAGSFQGDVVSRRQFRYLLTRANACVLVETRRGRVRGYVLLVFRRGATVARIYSIAVAAADRGQGVGAALLRAAGRAARRHGCDRVRAEVRCDNRASLALFERGGYRRFGFYRDYYADGEDAVRVEKRLEGKAPARPAPPPPVTAAAPRQ